MSLEPSLTGDLKLGLEDGITLKEAQAGAELKLTVGARVDLFAAEAEVDGGLAGKIDISYDRADNGNVRIAHAEADGFGDYRLRLLWFSTEGHGEWKLLAYPPKSSTTARLLPPRSPKPPLHIIGHAVGSPRETFRASGTSRQAFAEPTTGARRSAVAITGASSGSAVTTTTSILASAVYTYTEPALAVNPTSGDALLLWVHDDPSKVASQSKEIYYSRWHGGAWSPPASVTNDTQLDGAPQVVWTGDGKAVAVWQRLTDTLPATATLDAATAREVQIATATFDPVRGTWSPISLVTTNAALHTGPRLERNTVGDPMAVWRENVAGQIGGDAAYPDRIMAATYRNGWSTPVTAVDNIPGLDSLAVDYGAGRATIAYTQLVTPTGSITPTDQLFTSAWNGRAWAAPVQQTNDVVGQYSPQVVYNKSNQPLIIWLSGSNLRLRNLSTGSDVGLGLPVSLGTVDEFHVVQDGSGNIAAVFTAQAAQRDLYVAYYDQAHNLWGNPVRLTNDTASKAYPTAALDNTGRLLAAYAATALAPVTNTATLSTGEMVTYTVPSPRETDLVTLARTFVKNLTLTDADVALSDDHPARGRPSPSPLPFTTRATCPSTTSRSASTTAIPRRAGP